MKKLIVLVLFIAAFGTSGFSQLKFGAGANLLFDGTLFGVGGRVQYAINEDFAAQGGLNIFLDDVADYMIDLDVYYSGFELGDVEGFSLTPFAGLNIFRASVLGFGATDTGLTLGIQGLLPITDGLNLYVEPRLYLGGGDGFGISAGVYF